MIRGQGGARSEGVEGGLSEEVNESVGSALL
jgi:hypothetical protein